MAISTVPELAKVLEESAKVAKPESVNEPVLLSKPARAFAVPSRILAVVPVRVRAAALVVMPPLALVNCSVPPTV